MPGWSNLASIITKAQLQGYPLLTSDDHKKLVRLYIPQAELSAQEKCELSTDQAHYLRNVMRKAAGDGLRVFNGYDGEWLAKIKELNKNKAIIEIDKLLLKQTAASDIWVLASPVKKEAFDLMVQKACELGAAKFIPVICDHTVVHRMNQERLQAIAIEAAEQSERFDVMSIEPLIDLKDFLNQNEKRDLIFCSERSGNKASLIDVAKTLAGKPLSLLVGPEGGFSIAENNTLRNMKCVHPVSLGPRILKTETALISALSCIQLMA